MWSSCCLMDVFGYGLSAMAGVKYPAEAGEVQKATDAATVKEQATKLVEVYEAAKYEAQRRENEKKQYEYVIAQYQAAEEAGIARYTAEMARQAETERKAKEAVELAKKAETEKATHKAVSEEAARRKLEDERLKGP
jgi:Na+-transporting methylmalonyl-CoA/oxaloacetate decarboxylase gamma subunit